jgi:hypothetical protein|tara:strand:+ start:415 stop:582 length:168 start_codon:yes stop_codon:yes gene_type:complete
LQGRNIRVSEARARAPRAPDMPFEPSPWGDDRPKRGAGGKPKGSRRGLRARKRGF